LRFGGSVIVKQGDVSRKRRLSGVNSARGKWYAVYRQARMSRRFLGMPLPEARSLVVRVIAAQGTS
jgi:hypothetical protein